jgi:predicted SnoaL-like aldol condensation-catalyzing enzyme
MTIKTKERNKALVLEAFDTLIQHSARIPPGREGLSNLVRRVPTTLRYEAGVILADEDFVFVRGRFSDNRRPRNWIAADVVRIADGLLADLIKLTVKNGVNRIVTVDSDRATVGSFEPNNSHRFVGLPLSSDLPTNDEAPPKRYRICRQMQGLVSSSIRGQFAPVDLQMTGASPPSPFHA